MNQVEPTGALTKAYLLLLCRFSGHEAEGLAALKRRVDRGDFRETTDADRLRFARWLVARGHLTEWPDDGSRRPRPAGRDLQPVHTRIASGRA